MGADIHFVIERKHKNGWVGLYASDAASNWISSWLTPQRTKNSLQKLRERDYHFFARLAGVRGDGGEANGLPKDVSELTSMHLERDGSDAHSHFHMPIHDFVSQKLVDLASISEYAVHRLVGSDPVQEFMSHALDEFLTLDENTRVVGWFDN